MSLPLMNAREVFEIGVNIEKNGRSFYRAATLSAKEPHFRALFNELAEWEDKHVALFEDLLTALPANAGETGYWDPDDEAARYLRAAAGAHVFVAEKDPAKLAACCTSVSDVLHLAVSFEKDSVVYYTAVQKAVPEGLGRDQIARLIHEEMSHIAMLSEKLKQFS